jgi:hypothetical protein
MADTGALLFLFILFLLTMTEVAEREQPVSPQLPPTSLSLQGEGVKDMAHGRSSDEDTSDITDPHVISCLKEV